MRAPIQTIANARRLRRALTPPEARLWSRLRPRTPGTPVFRRQHPIGPYVLDFYCAKARLAVDPRTVIRGDGMSHDTGDRPQRDMQKDAWLKAHGVTVMRIAATDVLRRADDTADGIVRAAAAMIEAGVRRTPAEWGRTSAATPNLETVGPSAPVADSDSPSPPKPGDVH